LNSRFVPLTVQKVTDLELTPISSSLLEGLPAPANDAPYELTERERMLMAQGTPAWLAETACRIQETMCGMRETKRLEREASWLRLVPQPLLRPLAEFLLTLGRLIDSRTVFEVGSCAWNFQMLRATSVSRTSREVTRALGHPPRGVTLYVSHQWGGGIQHFIDDRAAEFRLADRDLLIAVPMGRASTVAALLAPNGVKELEKRARLDFADDPQNLGRLFRALNIEVVELQSAAGWSYRILEQLPKACRAGATPYRVMLHDYLPLCPHGLVDGALFYCGERGLEQCVACMRSPRDDARNVHLDIVVDDAIDILHWRSAYESLLSGADRLIAMSKDTADRFERYFDGVKVEARPPVETIEARCVTPTPGQGTRRKIAVIGFIQLHKGLGVLLDCAREALSRALPLDFVIVGYTSDDDATRAAEISVTGRYAEDEVFKLLEAERPDLIFLPSIWPETHLYTLSIAMATGLPVAVFDFGAQAARLKEAGAPALLLSPDLAKRPDLINEALLGFRFAH
jgi:glycosyltransferase involved in cell wall biosynthesis